MQAKIVWGLFLLTAVFWFSPCLLAENPAGTWDLVAETSYGEQYSLEMTLRGTPPEMTGTLQTPEGTTELDNIRLEENRLSFDVWVGNNNYHAELIIDGDVMTGSYEGGGESGTLTARRTGP